MNIYIRICAALLLCLLVAVPLRSQKRTASPPSPRLTCRVLNDQGRELPESKVFEASNLKRIPLRVTLTGSKQLLEAAVADSDAAARQPGRKPAVELTVYRVGDGGRSRVPVKLSTTGNGADGALQYLHVLLEIPVDAARRRENIDVLLKRALADPKTTPGQAQLLELSKSSVVSAMENLYMENRTGDYEVTCRLQSPAGDATVESAPARVKVVFVGNYYDKPNFRPQN